MAETEEIFTKLQAWFAVKEAEKDAKQQKAANEVKKKQAAEQKRFLAAQQRLELLVSLSFQHLGTLRRVSIRHGALQSIDQHDRRTGTG